ncbi:MAG: T9SS type A sorting domain-containing protein, partial [Bacteroidia bacterium]
IFNANASGNTVTIAYTTGAIPNPAAGYYNLKIAGASGTKTLPAATIVAKNLTINSNNTLNSNNFDLTVGGNWANSGTFTASVGKTVTFNGSTAQTVSNTLGTTTFKRILINNLNGVTLITGTYILDEVLTVSAGTFNTGGRPFTMTSNAAQTARIAPIGATGAIAGNFTIQRYITARDTTYADLASPVQSSTFADWDNELPAISYSYSPPNMYPSASTYDETADAYVPVTNSGTAISPGQGFEIFLSGDFSYANFPATTMNTIGTPNQGDHDLSGSISNNVQGWNLVGNPFASSIAWSSIYSNPGTSGLYDYIEMYDYTIADWHGYTSADAIEIGATQGFWVYGLPGNGAVSLNIPETSKTTSSNSSIKCLNKIPPYFTLTISNADGLNSFAHTFKIGASSDASDGLDNKDVPFHPSPCKATPQMYSFVEGKKININTFNSNNENFSMPLRTQVTGTGNYKISAAGFDFVSDYTCIKLEDKLLNKIIDLTSQDTYICQMEPTDDANRFIVHFSKNNNCKSFVASNAVSNDFANKIDILPTTEGNVVNFNLNETTNSTISVVNLLGQTIVEGISVEANTQSINVALPENFSGMYIIRVSSSKGNFTKKFVRK